MATLLRLAAVALLALQLCALTQAAWVPLGDRVASAEVMEGACRGQGSRTVCYPTNSVSQYLHCRPGQMPITRTCPRGQLYDYVSRRCERSSTARTCPWWPVPRAIQFGLPDANNTNGPALSAPFGQFGVPGNFTFDLDIAGHFALYCPLIGHGSIGQNMEYTVTCPAPADRIPYTFRVDLEPVLLNSDAYPKRVASLEAYCGDKLNVIWSGPFHLGQIGNFSPYNRAQWQNQLVMARPPQPVYRCPMYTYMPAPPPAPPGFVVLVPNPGDELLISPTTDPWNVTIVANTSSTFFLLDPAAAYCRMGLVFKVTVLPQPVGRRPATVSVSWEHRNENLEDQILYVGDSLYIHKDSFVQESALARVPSVPFINARI